MPHWGQSLSIEAVGQDNVICLRAADGGNLLCKINKASALAV